MNGRAEMRNCRGYVEAYGKGRVSRRQEAGLSWQEEAQTRDVEQKQVTRAAKWGPGIHAWLFLHLQ